jgi:hypothetical protein
VSFNNKGNQNGIGEIMKINWLWYTGAFIILTAVVGIFLLMSILAVGIIH